MKFKKKPVIVDAFCPGLDGGIVPDWFNDMLANGTIIECLDGDGYDIHTLEGTMHASPGERSQRTGKECALYLDMTGGVEK